MMGARRAREGAGRLWRKREPFETQTRAGTEQASRSLHSFKLSRLPHIRSRSHIHNMFEARLVQGNVLKKIVDAAAANGKQEQVLRCTMDSDEIRGANVMVSCVAAVLSAASSSSTALCSELGVVCDA